MTHKETEVQKICNCLSVLTSEINIDESSKNFKGYKNIKEALCAEFKRNLHLTFSKLEIYSDVKTSIANHIEICPSEICKNCDQFKFLKLCLTFLKLLKSVLLKEANCATDHEDKASQSKPKGILSISQQSTVQKCLQFIVALGILPNLPRGVGMPLYRRTQHAVIVEHFIPENSWYQKHIPIAECLETLVECLECTAMQSSILTYHGSDMLASLLFLCHAPIDETGKEKESSAASTSKDDSTSGIQMTNMKLENRNRFSPHLKAFLTQISPSLLLWELLLFQGIPMQNKKSEITKTEVPVWLNTICNQMLVDMILKKFGIAHLVDVVLDKVFGIDIQSEKVDSVRIEAVAGIIAYLPVHHISVEDYIQKLSQQVLDNLHLEDSAPTSHVLKYVASCIVLQLCKRNIKSARQHLLNKLLKPLKSCVQEPASTQLTIVVKESELTTCIEDLHQIFITAASPTSRKYTRLLFPYSHCLCDMLFFMLEGKSFLKSKVKNLICTVLSNSTKEKSLSLLDVVCFSSKDNCGIYITKVNFENGEEGGILAVPKEETDLPHQSDCHHAISDILSDLQNKDLIRSYILLILKEFSHFYFESENSMEDQNKKVAALFSAIQGIADWNVNIEEALVSNLSEVIDVLVTLLENMSNCRSNTTFYEETLFVVMMILNSILNSYDQLKSTDWAALKKCLPSLQKLQKSGIGSNLKEIMFSNITHIATHGATCKSDAKTKTIPTEDQAKNTRFPQELDPEHTANSKISISEINESGDKNRLSESQTNYNLDKSLSSTVSSVFEDLSMKTNEPKCKYEEAMQDAKNPLVYIRGHGLIALGNLLYYRDENALNDKKELLNIFLENLGDDDSYVFLSAINGLCILAGIDSQTVLPVILNLYKTSKDKSIILKLGEALPKICNSLEDMIFNYKDLLLTTFLDGTKVEDADIQSSNLSNLGQTCMCLKFNISDHWLQEILECSLSFLKAGQDLSVRRSAVMVVYQLLQGIGRNMIGVLQNEIKNIYFQLKLIYTTETDDVLCLHSQLALEEINVIMKDLLSTKTVLKKEIRIFQ